MSAVFFKRTNTFRLSQEEVGEFNSMFERLHPVNKPQALRELFVNMFTSYVNKTANEAENATANVNVTAPANAENVNANDVSALEQKIKDLQNELSVANQGQSVMMELVTLLEPFRKETEEAFKTLFTDERFVGLSYIDLIELLLDYAKRDPSSEFPFEPVARPIYNNIKAKV